MPNSPLDNTGGLCVLRLGKLHPGLNGFTLTSDWQLGARNLDEGLLKEEITEARSKGDRILANGDLADCIFPGDRRWSPATYHDRLAGRDDVQNELVRWGMEYLSPVADRVDMLGVGNHDVGGTKKTGFDFVAALTDGLNTRLRSKGNDHRVTYGGYAGLIEYANPVRNAEPLRIFYHHGWRKSADLSSALKYLCEAKKKLQFHNFSRQCLIVFSVIE